MNIAFRSAFDSIAHSAAGISALLLSAALAVACSASGGRADEASGADTASAPVCQDGATTPCSCAGGQTASQECSGGQWGACNCGFQPAPVVCGDGVCSPKSSSSAGENCKSCPSDCGECPRCASAPTCTNAVGVPSSTTTRADLVVDDTKKVTSAPADAGAGAPQPEPSASGCDAPQLRLRLGKIQTYSGGATVYCVVNATDGVTSEAAVTSKTKALDDGEAYFFDPDVGIFWGQHDLQKTTNNLAITYNCFKVNSDAWAKVLQAGADEAAKAGGYAGPYGWAFGTAAVGASVAAAAIQAASGDELIFNAQQIVDKTKLLDLTNARSWTLRKAHDGGFFGWSWDWQLTIESWGCADGTLPPG